jgi:hypothetical protein
MTAEQKKPIRKSSLDLKGCQVGQQAAPELVNGDETGLEDSEKLPPSFLAHGQIDFVERLENLSVRSNVL